MEGTTVYKIVPGCRYRIGMYLLANFIYPKWTLFYANYLPNEYLRGHIFK